MKFGILFSAFAFAISFLLGLFSGSPIFIVCLRALIFAAVFFSMGFGLFFFCTNILGLGDTTHSAQFVDISVGDDTTGSVRRQTGNFGAEFNAQPLEGDAPQADTAFSPEVSPSEPGKLDDISLLFSGTTNFEDALRPEAAGGDGAPQFNTAMERPGGGLEQNTDSAYNKFGSVVTPASEDSPSPQDFSNFVPGIPGLEGVYSAGSGNTASGGDSSGGQNRLMVGTVEMSIEKPKKETEFGNHDGKKMAGAIQTMLKKDDE